MCRSFITLACICLIVNINYSSSIVPFNNLDHLSQTSDVVVVVRAMPERVININGYSEFIRDFEVLEVLKGEVGEQLTVKSGKRTMGDYTNIIHGEFDFHNQDSYLLFLQEQQDGSYYPICLSYYVFQEISKQGKAYFVPRYEEGALQLLGNKKERILNVYQKETFISAIKDFVSEGTPIQAEQIKALEAEQMLREQIKKASPAHCTFLQSNNGLRYQVENLNSQVLPIYYQTNGAECAAVAAEMNAAVNHMNENYTGIQLDLAGASSGYTPDCSGNRAYNISFFGGNYDLFMDQNYGTSRAVMVQFGDPCNEIPALNNCSGTVAFGGTWAIGSHQSNGESFNTAVYGYVLVNEGMGNCNCGDFSGNSPVSDFSAIIAHELSHTVGLNHIASNFGQANMNPISGAEITNLDVQCMDDLYPTDATTNTETEPDPEPTGTPDLRINRCGSVSISGTTVNISNLQIQNSGNASTTRNSRIGIYVSSDNTIHTSDQLMTTAVVPVLATGSSTTFNLSFTTTTIPDGSYVVGMFVDDSNVINESNESNNTCIDANPQLVIDTAPAGQADLRVNQCATVSISGNTVALNNLNVLNSGNATANAGAVIRYYLSTDNSITTSDILLGSFNLPGLLAGASVNVNQSFNVSALGLADGAYTAGLIIDATNVIPESNETNNSCFDNAPQLIIDTAPPAQADLRIGGCGSVSINGSVVSINNLVVTNSGDGNAGNGARVGYYLSINNVINTNDYLLGSQVLPALAANAQTTISNSYNISGISIEDGTYKVGMIVDYTNRIAESDETNNTCRDNSPTVVIDSKPPGVPDLTMSSCGTLTVNQSIATLSNATVSNVGTLASGAGAVVSFYVSADQNVSGNDRLIGSIAIPSLEPNASANFNQSVNVSSLNLADGVYAVGAIADASSVIAESNESNNSCVISSPSLIIETQEPPSGNADLEITNCGTATVNGNAIAINNVVVRNTGVVETEDYSFLGYYLSSDKTIDATDIYLGYDYVNSLVANSQSAESASFNISNIELSDGEYYIGALADFGDRVNEEDEANNGCFINNPKVVIGQSTSTDPVDYVDLVVECGDISQTTNSVSLNKIVVRNQGNTAARRIFVGYYLSLDRTITTDDYLLELGQDYIANLRAGSQSTQSGTFSLNGIPHGDYYIGAIVDHTNTVSESNEQNNTCHISATKVKVGAILNGEPDLSISCNEAALNGNELIVSNVTTQNIGDAGTGGYSFVGYFLSTDETITTSDHYLGYDFVNVLASGATNTQQETFQLHSLDLEDGEYYVGAVSDFTSRISETDLSNNTCVFDDVFIQIGQQTDVAEGECGQFNFTDFEDGKLGVWTDGGGHAFVNAGSTFATSGARSMAIRGNQSDHSSIYSTDWIEQDGFSELNVSFNFYAFLMESGDSFVLELDEGNGYSVIKEWKAGIDFTTAETSQAEVSIPITGAVKLKFRCVSSHTYEYIFLDDILIERCKAGPNVIAQPISSQSQSLEKELPLHAEVFPNPVNEHEWITLNLNKKLDSATVTVYLFDELGKLVKKAILPSRDTRLSTVGLGAGRYVLVLDVAGERVVKQVVVL